jgi:hypothetical protein
LEKTVDFTNMIPFLRSNEDESIKKKKRNGSNSGFRTFLYSPNANSTNQFV